MRPGAERVVIDLVVPDDDASAELLLNLRGVWNQQMREVTVLPDPPSQWRQTEHKVKSFDASVEARKFSRVQLMDIGVIKAEFQSTRACLENFETSDEAFIFSKRICFACARVVRLRRADSPTEMKSNLDEHIRTASPVRV